MALIHHAVQMLKDTLLTPNFPIRELATAAEGKSGSDLKEICRNAAMLPVREFVRKADGDPELLARSQETVCACSCPSIR